MSSSKGKVSEVKRPEEKAPEEKAPEEEQHEEKPEELPPEPPYVDCDTAFDDEEEGLSAERKALNFTNENTVNILPTKEYLEKTVLTELLKALKITARERPENPVEFVAYYM